jgi:hypothetical protein
VWWEENRDNSVLLAYPGEIVPAMCRAIIENQKCRAVIRSFSPSINQLWHKGVFHPIVEDLDINE